MCLIISIHLYDVQRVLILQASTNYTLYYWDYGWNPIKQTQPSDSITLDFGIIPHTSLFLIEGTNGIEKMQRPFVIKNSKVEFY